MHILLFGGSFNPPHIGHLIVMEQAFELIPNLDELWLLPCNNHTFNKTLAPAPDRLAMCQLLIDEAVQALPTIKLCSIEIDYKLSGSTYETLQLLQTKYPNHQFSFLIGSDQLPVFTKWQNWEKLLKEMPFYVYPRSSYPLEPLYPGMTALSSPTQIITNISSTLVRQRLTQHLPIAQLLPATIQAYISEHLLYDQTSSNKP